MELKKGQIVHIGKQKITGSIPDELAEKIGLKKPNKDYKKK